MERIPLVLSCAKIALNMYTRENSDRYTIRNYEIPAAGAFQLAERTDEAKELFEEGKEAAYFSDDNELCEKSLFYLTNDSQRVAIAEAGTRRLVNSGYSYVDRLREMLYLLSRE